MTERVTGRLNRRQMLTRSVGVGAAMALAGCPGEGGEGTTGTGGDGGTPQTSEPAGTGTEDLPGTPLDCGAELPVEITGDTVLQEGCAYTIPERGAQDTVKIRNGATLYVQPGVEMEVGAGMSINVDDGGAITAQGTEDNPIEIRGSDSVSGHWQGIEIRTDNPANELSHVTVADAGNVYWESAIVMHRTDAAQATIQHCTVRNSSSAGIMAHKVGELVDFRDNHVEDCQGPPLRLHPNQLRSLTATTTFANNAQSYIQVRPSLGGSDEAASEDGTWPAMDLPYEFVATTSIEGEIQIEAGATLQFRSGDPTRLFVSNGGQMVAEGTADEPITYRGVEHSPGYWGGIFIRTTKDNVLRNVDVRHGGGGYRNANIGVGIDDPGKLTITDSEIAHSGGWGLIFEEGTLTAENNTYSDNAQGTIQRSDT